MHSPSRAFCFRIPQRWIIIVMCCLGLFNSFTTRLCLSVAITEMVVHKNHSSESIDDTCPKTDQIISSRNETVIGKGSLDWDEKTQGLILSSVYWGYVLTSLLAGKILNKIGGKHTLGLSILSISILTLLTPLTVKWGGAIWLIVLRVFVGFGEGAIQPSVTRLMAHWIPEDERSWAGAWAYSGMCLGSIVGLAGSGSIIQRSGIGWPAAFYFYGALGVVSFLIHCGFCYSSPSEHPFISDTERNYLKQKLGNTHKDIPPTPWIHIVRSKPIWALLVALIGKGWCLLILASDMPKYMSSVLHFSVEANGYITSIPYICSWIFSCVVSWIADFIITKKLLSIGCVRKIGCSISMTGTGLFLVIATYVGCNRFVVVGIQILAMMMFGCTNFGIMVNALDLAPNYAGAIQGVTFGISTIASFLTPYIVGLLTPNQTINEWRYVFWMLFAVCGFTNIFFVTFASGDRQEWNEQSFLGKKPKLESVKQKKKTVRVLCLR